MTSLDVNGTWSLNVLSVSTESLVFSWETDSSSLPFLLRNLANTNDLYLHVPISSMFAAAFRYLFFTMSCTIPTAELGIRPPSVSLHMSTHFAKADVSSFWSIELVHLRHVELFLQHFPQTHSKRRRTTVHLVLSGPVPVVEDAVFPVLLFHYVQKQVLVLLSIVVKSELPISPLLFQTETWRPFVADFLLSKICQKSSVMIGFPFYLLFGRNSCARDSVSNLQWQGTHEDLVGQKENLQLSSPNSVHNLAVATKYLSGRALRS